ncbi:hypothetical protein [Leclercia adecarboxylata]|uniref:hypothetical protein n=1 Tax=Leclercia adecarboxylata TaxID=83655 RepID=UPI0013CA0940|nr:hypothetical protein [Leclercia adecarboxylata]NEG94348.1 hypothetical protein [Leclercia adecarboxylata]
MTCEHIKPLVDEFEGLLAGIQAKCSGFSADSGVRTVRFIRQFTTEYADLLEVTPLEVLAAVEKARDYSAPNYYQQTNFPDLKGVTVFASLGALQAAIPSKQFRCPCCMGVSSDPYTCNSGEKQKDGSVCNWTSYGLFGTLGKGLRVLIKDAFLTQPRVHEIFMPLELETDPPADATAA